MPTDYRYRLPLPAGLTLAVGPSTFRLPDEVEMLAAPKEGANVWLVPFNNGLAEVPGSIGPVAVLGRTSIALTKDEAAVNDYNTSLVTCRWCGSWLGDDADGYGTQHGWCGCTEDPEEGNRR